MKIKPLRKAGTKVLNGKKLHVKWSLGKKAVGWMKIMPIPVNVKRGNMLMDKSSNGDHNFYPHKSDMIVKDDDASDDVCSRSTSEEDTEYASERAATVDEPRMDWLMFKYKKPADGMLPTHMEKGIKSFAYYQFLVTFLWILWPHENEFIYWSRRESLHFHSPY